MQDEGNTMPDAELEKMIMFSLGVSEHNAQRYKDIERVFNEFYDCNDCNRFNVESI